MELTKDDLSGAGTPKSLSTTNPPTEATTPPPVREKSEKQTENEIERLKAQLWTQQKDNERLQNQLEYAQAEKRKPGITVVDEEGKQAKNKKPNSWGLSDLVLPPYTKGRVAIYKICGSEGINPATGLPVEPVDTSIPGRYTFDDRFEKDPLKRRKTIQNITGTENYLDDGEMKIREKVEDVIFVRGFLQVNVVSQYPLYVFMELHTNNKNNKYRPTNSYNIFERVDINMKSPAAQAANLDLVIDAGKAVKDMNKEDVLGYAAGVAEISTASGRLLHEIKTDLQRWAMSNPVLFFKMNKNAKAAVQINVLTAIDFGLIGYRNDVKSYVDLETDQIICTNTPSQDPMEVLVQFLSKDTGKIWYDQILSRLNYWE